jgi:hypothetical protein
MSEFKAESKTAESMQQLLVFGKECLEQSQVINLIYTCRVGDVSETIRFCSHSIEDGMKAAEVYEDTTERIEKAFD